MVMTATLAPDSPDNQDGSAPPRGSAYAQLSRDIKRAGLLERRPLSYATRIAITVALVCGAAVGFFLLGDSWWQLGLAAFFALTSTQLGFLGHDAGHQQVFRSRNANYVLGVLFANVTIGLSYGWWVDKHNRHHAHPNDEHRDPDVGGGALVFTESQARASRGVSRWF